MLEKHGSAGASPSISAGAGLRQRRVRASRAVWFQSMSDRTLSDLTALVVRHRDEREWGQFHTPKELAISLCVESAELLGLMQWKSGVQLQETVKTKRPQIADELADVLHSVLLLAEEVGISLGDALVEKLEKDSVKYPVHKARGKNLKYDEL
jgi:NTP pyrophosphatase (non-canonical NTP hydrolase)